MVKKIMCRVVPLLYAVLGSLILGLGINISTEAQVLDRTVAIVKLYKTENISRTKLDKQYQFWSKQTGQQPKDDEKKEILEATINDALIMQAAVKDRIVATAQQIDEIIKLRKQEIGVSISDKDFRELINQKTGLSWNDFRKQVENRIIQEQYIARKYSDDLKKYDAPTDKQVQEMYDQVATQFINPAMVRVSHLFFDTRKEGADDAQEQKKAYELASKINNSAKLFDQYLEKSVDDPSFQGGDLGYIVRDSRTKSVLGDDFLAKIFSMNKNTISGVLKSNGGYHIVKQVDKREPRLLKLKDPLLPGETVTVEQRIKQVLISRNQEEKFITLIQKEVDQLRKTADIKYLYKNL